MTTASPRTVNRIAKFLDPVAARREFEDEMAMAERRLKATERHVDPNIVIWAINFIYVTFPDARGEIEGWSLQQVVAFATDLL